MALKMVQSCERLKKISVYLVIYYLFMYLSRLLTYLLIHFLCYFLFISLFCIQLFTATYLTYITNHTPRTPSPLISIKAVKSSNIYLGYIHSMVRRGAMTNKKCCQGGGHPPRPPITPPLNSVTHSPKHAHA